MLQTHEFLVADIVSVSKKLNYLEEPFTPSALESTELELVLALNRDSNNNLYNCLSSTPVQFVLFMLRHKERLLPWQLGLLSAVLENSYADIKFCRFRPSVQAASVLSVTRKHLGSSGDTFRWREPTLSLNPDWTHELSECTQMLDERFIRTCSTALADCCSRSPRLGGLDSEASTSLDRQA
jgi:hypothetical protein